VSRERLGARSDFDEWANAVVAAVKKHRSRFGASPSAAHGRGRTGLRRFASRMRTKIAD
jgi:FAD/FMN-containing dehydrogenase